MAANDVPRKNPHRAAEPEIWEAVVPDLRAHSGALEIVGRAYAFSGEGCVDSDEAPKPDTLRELALYDEIVALGDPHRAKRAGKVLKATPDHLAVIRWLDRCGCMTLEQLRRAVMPAASVRAMQILLQRMHQTGLIEWRGTQLLHRRDRPRGGSRPRMWSLTAAGFRLGQRSPGFYRPAIPPSRAWRRSETEKPARLHHDLHVISWCLAFRAIIDTAVDVREIFTPRYEEGQIAPPRIPDGRGSRPIELRDIRLEEDLAFAGVPNEPFAGALHPDLTIQFQISRYLLGRDDDARIELLLELDRSKRPAYNRQKFERYDAFLTSWALAHPRVQELGSRPVVIFTSPDERRMLGLMKTADEVMTGRIGLPGDPEVQWYHPGRDHVLFTTEEQVHHGSLLAWRLPEHPKRLREALCDDRFPITTVGILPPDIIPWEAP